MKDSFLIAWYTFSAAEALPGWHSVLPQHHSPTWCGTDLDSLRWSCFSFKFWKSFCASYVWLPWKVMARARYSTWLGATKPTFIDTDSQNLVRLQLKRVRHPLLLQQHREALREAKATLKSKSKVCSLTLYYTEPPLWVLFHMHLNCFVQHVAYMLR